MTVAVMARRRRSSWRPMAEAMLGVSSARYATTSPFASRIVYLFACSKPSTMVPHSISRVTINAERLNTGANAAWNRTRV